MKGFYLAALSLLLISCSAVKTTPTKQGLIELNASASDTIVIIYNHGTRNPRKKERCDASYNQIPASLKDIESNRLLIYFLCSVATEGEGPEHAGNQVYARMYEIEQALDKLLQQGIQARHIFLAGHSKGAWSSLMLMNRVDKKFNAAILFAPALANRRSQQTHPWWRNEVRPRQIKQMLTAQEIKALIFAYRDDEYNRPQDLQFLIDHYPDSVEIIGYRCAYKYTHNTHLHDCRQSQTSKRITDYINQQIQQWPLN